MLRQDRNKIEKYFAAGYLKVLCCTATLAWGVNLPAHAVVIKGTDLYNAEKGTYVDLGILDVLQVGMCEPWDSGLVDKPLTCRSVTVLTTNDDIIPTY